jgi:hypothetical protein
LQPPKMKQPSTPLVTFGRHRCKCCLFVFCSVCAPKECYKYVVMVIDISISIVLYRVAWRWRQSMRLVVLSFP